MSRCPDVQNTWYLLSFPYEESMSFKLKKAIIEVDYGKSFASLTFNADQNVEHPLLGDHKFLVPFEAKMNEAEINKLPLINSSGQMQIIRDIGMHGVYYIFMQEGYLLDKIITEPDEIVIDIFFKENQLIYCFYNPSHHKSIKIVAHKEKGGEKVLAKLAVDPADIIWRQYFIRKAIVRPDTDLPSIMTQTQVADYLQLKIKTIQNWTSENKIPYKKVGGVPRYLKAEIDDAIRSEMLGKKKK
jgi:excisionase family DNA binding protein